MRTCGKKFDRHPDDFSSLRILDKKGIQLENWIPFDADCGLFRCGELSGTNLRNSSIVYICNECRIEGGIEW